MIAGDFRVSVIFVVIGRGWCGINIGQLGRRTLAAAATSTTISGPTLRCLGALRVAVVILGLRVSVEQIVQI